MSQAVVDTTRVSGLFGRRAGALVERMVEDAEIAVGRDLIVHDSRMWADWAARGMLGIGESYMRGDWDAPHVDVVMARLAALPSARKRALFRSASNSVLLAANAALNPQRRSRELQIAVAHYDLGNDFFESWLDANMQYSCARWKGAADLDAAQVAKLRAIGEKLQLEPGMRVLDLGCGWGGLGRFLIREFGVRVTGVNISAAQTQYCRQEARAQGMHAEFEVRQQSWRDVRGVWDRVVSVGMLEHVGPANYADFFGCVHACLAPTGVSLIQTIGSNKSQAILNDRWITRYIFPNGTLPSIAQVAAAVELKLVIEDIENLGPDYDQTLMAWHANFQRAKPQLQRSRVFERMWDFYLLYCASGFRVRKTQLWQFALSKGRSTRYERYPARL